MDQRVVILVAAVVVPLLVLLAWTAAVMLMLSFLSRRYLRRVEGTLEVERARADELRVQVGVLAESVVRTVERLKRRR